MKLASIVSAIAIMTGGRAASATIPFHAAASGRVSSGGCNGPNDRATAASTSAVRSIS